MACESTYKPACHEGTKQHVMQGQWLLVAQLFMCSWGSQQQAMTDSKGAAATRQNGERMGLKWLALTATAVKGTA